MVARTAPRAARPSALTAYLLHRYPWSESSLILDLFTREQGRIAVAAKGARRPYSQLRSVLLPFQPIHVALGRVPRLGSEEDPALHEVRNLRSAEWAGGAPMLGGAALFSGFYLNELLMKLLARQDPHAALFDAYAATLPMLAGGDELRIESALRAFELTMLKEIGLLPDLATTTLRLLPLDAGRGYHLLHDSGVAEADDEGDAGIPGHALVGLQAALDHGSLAALQQACQPVLPQLKSTLRNLLYSHLGSGLLRTRQVMLGVQALESTRVDRNR